MIARLAGTLESVSAAEGLVIDVSGVGYQVFCSGRTAARIGGKGDRVALLIDTHVREDHIHLYGFCDRLEQEWFRLLTSVQGVGARVGMAILSACPPEQLATAIAAGDAAFLRQAEGVGPKLAARIVTELKDKAGKIGVAPAIPATAGKVAAGAGPQGLQEDAVLALMGLGYNRGIAYSAVMKACARRESSGKANDNLQALITDTLRDLAAG